MTERDLQMKRTDQLVSPYEQQTLLMKKATFKLQPTLQEKILRVQAKRMYEPPSFYGVF